MSDLRSQSFWELIDEFGVQDEQNVTLLLKSMPVFFVIFFIFLFISSQPCLALAPIQVNPGEQHGQLGSRKPHFPAGLPA